MTNLQAAQQNSWCCFQEAQAPQLQGPLWQCLASLLELRLQQWRHSSSLRRPGQTDPGFLSACAAGRLVPQVLQALDAASAPCWVPLMQSSRWVGTMAPDTVPFPPVVCPKALTTGAAAKLLVGGSRDMALPRCRQPVPGQAQRCPICNIFAAGL